MVSLIVRLIISTIMVLVADNLLSGVQVDSTQTALIVAVVMGLLNTFVKPIISFFSLPLTIITLGLFYLVINVIIVFLCAYLVNGFSVDGFLNALIFGFLLSLGQTVAGWFLD